MVKDSDLSKKRTPTRKTALLLFSPLLPLVFLCAFTSARQFWYSHQIIDKDLKRWDGSSQDFVPAFLERNAEADGAISELDSFSRPLGF